MDILDFEDGVNHYEWCIDDLVPLKNNEATLKLYECIICIQITVNNKKCNRCNTIVCYSCFDTLKKNNKNKCPQCQIGINEIIDLPELSIMTLMQFNVQCKYDNCLKLFTIENINNHLKKDCKNFLIQEVYDDDVLIYKGVWKDSCYHGEGILYYHSKIIRYEGRFKNGLYDGKGREFDSNGKLIKEGVFREGKLNGEGKIYWPNGKVMVEGVFKDGKQFEKVFRYWDNGNKIYQLEKYQDVDDEMLYDSEEEEFEECAINDIENKQKHDFKSISV